MFDDASPLPSACATADGLGVIALRVLRSARARRYLLRLDLDGVARLVIPRWGSRAEAMRFLERSRDWLQRRHGQWLVHRRERKLWLDGAELLFRGEPVRLRVEADLLGASLFFAGEVLRGVAPAEDYRPVIQVHWRVLAERELPLRTRELAAAHGIAIKRITIRAQKTRWGSCSSRGTISLNWRLIQAPPFVRRLSHHPRAHAPPADEPQRALLETRRRRLPALARGGDVAEKDANRECFERAEAEFR